MESVLQKRIIDIIGLPIDLGADRRGVDMGPSALRIAGLATKLEKMAYEVIDKGDIKIKSIESQSISNPKLKYLDEIVYASETLAQETESSLLEGHFPLCIGGDHSLAIGSIAGVSSYCAKEGKRLGVIWIDAHSDMNIEETTPSGNIHGMPMATSLGLGSDKLVDIYRKGPKIKAENCALVAIRSIDDLEKGLIRKIQLPIYTMTDIDRRGASTVIDEILTNLSNKTDHIHVSFDIDSLDPSVAMGVGTLVPGGLTYREAHLIMETIAERGMMGSMDIAEINPILDHKNVSAEIAVEIAASILGKRII